MGANTFLDFSDIQDAKAAFIRAKSRYPSEGYSGTIAEKDKYIVIQTVDSFEEAQKLAFKLIDANDPRIDDKWGPAGAIKVKGQGWAFFGWASS